VARPPGPAMVPPIALSPEPCEPVVCHLATGHGGKLTWSRISDTLNRDVSTWK